MAELHPNPDHTNQQPYSALYTKKTFNCRILVGGVAPKHFI